MGFIKSLLGFGLLALTQASAIPYPGEEIQQHGCGEVDAIFVGLPPYHPLVTEQGFDPAVVNENLRRDAADIVKAGYNLRVVLMGPEEPLEKLEEQVRGIDWDGTGVGYGVRGARLPELTVRFEDIVSLYRREVPDAPIMFNYSPDSALWAISRNFPFASNCTTPGTDLGFEVICDICEQ